MVDGRPPTEESVKAVFACGRARAARKRIRMRRKGGEMQQRGHEVMGWVEWGVNR